MKKKIHFDLLFILVELQGHIVIKNPFTIPGKVKKNVWPSFSRLCQCIGETFLLR